MSSEPYLIPFGTLRAHTYAVTAIQVPSNDHYSRLMIVSTSRDKSLIVWVLHPDPTVLTTSPAAAYGQPVSRLTGHNNFVQDVALSSDGLYAISASWDRDLRFWNLSSTAKSTRFSAHTNDFLSVAFSPDNRRIISGSRDKTVRVWNTLGECKFTLEGHSDWVSAVRFVPDSAYPTPTPSQTLSAKVVSGSWDSTVKVWDVGRCKLVSTLEGHRGYVNTVAVSPDGSLCASGGRDGVVILWDLGEAKVLYERSVGAIVHALGFCPMRYWLAAASERSVSIWNLETKTLVQELLPGQHESLGRKFEDLQGHENGGLESNNGHDDDRKKIVVQLVPTPPAVKNNKKSYCTSLAWSNDGDTLFTGYSDGVIRVWTFCPTRF